jgi:hypothetical protein
MLKQFVVESTYSSRLETSHSATLLRMETIQTIEAIAGFLSGVRDNALYTEFRAQQHSKLLLKIKGCPISLEVATSVLDAIKKIDWSSEELGSLQAEVVNSSQLSTVSVGRKVLQDYSSLAAYLPAAAWDALLGTALSAQAKLEQLLMFGQMLGLSNPSETTMQFLCAVFLLATEGQKALSMPPALRLETLRMIKKVWKQIVARTSTALFPHLVKLPVSVGDLEAKYQEEYKKAFVDGQPVACRLSWCDISVCATGTPMRGRCSFQQLPLTGHTSASSSLDMGAYPSVPALLSGMAQIFANGVPFQQQPSMPMAMLSAPQVKIQKRLEQRLQLPAPLQEQQLLQNAQPCLDLERENASKTVSEAGFAVSQVHAGSLNSSAAVGHIQSQPVLQMLPSTPKLGNSRSIDAATAIVMEAMSAKKSTAEQSEKKKNNAKPKLPKAQAPKAMKAEARKAKKAEPLKVRKAEKVKAKSVKKLKAVPSMAQRLKLRPKGCTKCRGKPGCCPSCF